MPDQWPKGYVLIIDRQEVLGLISALARRPTCSDCSMFSSKTLVNTMQEFIGRHQQRALLHRLGSFVKKIGFNTIIKQQIK